MSNRIVIFNLIAILSIVVSFFYFTNNYIDTLKFVAYFLILLIGGFGFLNLFDLKLKNSNLHLIIAILAGISLNSFLFLGLKLLNLNTIYSLGLLFSLAIIFILVDLRKAREIISGIDFHRDSLLILVILIMFFSMFLISDNIYYLDDSVTVADPGTPTYELSNAHSLSSSYPFPDISYSGKGFRYHYGNMAPIFQLVNNFKVDELNLIYLLIPALFLFLLIFFVNELSKAVRDTSLRMIFIVAMFFSSIGLIAFVNPPYLNGFVLVSMFGNYATATLMLIALFILIQVDNRSFMLESLFIASMAIMKSPFLIPIAGSYLIASLENFLKKDFRGFFVKNLAILPGLVYFFVFVWGTYEQNLWVIFPGFYNIASTTLNKSYLLFYALLSLIMIIIGYVGLGIFYLAHIIKKIIRARKEFSFDKPIYFLFLIITISYLLGTFTSEISESNQLVFLTSGYIILSLLTYRYLLNKNTNRKLYAFLIILFLIFNFILNIGNAYFYQSSKLVLDKENTIKNNFLANLKRDLIGKVINITDSRDKIKFKRCSYSNDLIGGLRVLSQKSEGIFVFNRLYEVCESYGLKAWIPSSTTGPIRTALAKKQTIIEGHRSKGLISQPDYCNRTFENIEFFTIITGEESKFNDYIGSILNSNIPQFEDLSYYGYFKRYDKKNTNYFSANERFIDCIAEKPREIEFTKYQKVDYLRDYISKYKVKYFLFERGDIPNDEYIKELGLESIYSSKTVMIYEVI